MGRDFFKAHPPTLLAAFFYFDVSFMVWIILGPLGVQIARELHLDAAQKGVMIAVPALSGAFLRVASGVMVDRIKPKRTGSIGRSIVRRGAAARLALVSPAMSRHRPRHRRRRQFRHEIGVMTGLVGMTGRVGGFYLASSLGYSKQLTGSYQAGLLVFAALAALSLIGLTGWRTTWGPMAGVARI